MSVRSLGASAFRSHRAAGVAGMRLSQPGLALVLEVAGCRCRG